VNPTSQPKNGEGRAPGEIYFRVGRLGRKEPEKGSGLGACDDRNECGVTGKPKGSGFKSLY